MNHMTWRSSISAFLVVAAALAASSCGSSSSQSSHLIYVSTGQGIYGFRVNDKDGTSSELPSDPFIVGNTPSGFVLDSSGQRGYVANQADNTISLVKIDTTSGTISEVLPRTSIGNVAFSPDQLLLDSAGATLFSANKVSNNISTFSVGSNGALTLQGTTSLPDSPANMAFGNNLLFVATPNINRVYVFSLNSGALTAVNGSPLFVSGGVGTVTVDPGAKFLYVTNPGNNSISGYSIQYSGGNITLTAIPGSPFVPSGNASAIAPISSILDSTATHLYVANATSNNISQFSVGTDGSLTSLSPSVVTTGTGPRVLTFDPINKYLLVGSNGSKNVTQMKVNADATLSSSGRTILIQSVPQAIVVAH